MCGTLCSSAEERAKFRQMPSVLGLIFASAALRFEFGELFWQIQLVWLALLPLRMLRYVTMMPRWAMFPLTHSAGTAMSRITYGA
ncbi:hypothetical protein Q31a_33510 [Aureliella helgolandensis]|uniref:Uncharacterized protein n=1 Tax=Aureliella helgolandensis TaxID=2527968 RepID=A0A518G8Y7_9BACT|nr:hypothetical protein Q31a_33510 [Aureliella helgolandensis]